MSDQTTEQQVTAVGPADEYAERFNESWAAARRAHEEATSSSPHAWTM